MMKVIRVHSRGFWLNPRDVGCLNPRHKLGVEAARTVLATAGVMAGLNAAGLKVIK